MQRSQKAEIVDRCIPTPAEQLIPVHVMPVTENVGESLRDLVQAIVLGEPNATCTTIPAPSTSTP